MNIEEALDDLLNQYPEKAVHQILVTRLIRNNLIVDYKDKKYLFINNIQWIRLMHELKPLLQRDVIQEQLFPPNVIGRYYGIPVYENEELVKEILTHFSEQIIRDLFPTIPLDFS